jgi:putative addiction module component (TIGR02574 family)
MTISQHEIEMLTVEERLELIERVWDSLAVTQDDVPLTDSQRAELDRRIDELEEKGPVGIPWEQVVEGI